MKIYDINGYVDIPAILALGMPFTFIVGGRGTGKTYGALKYVRDNDIRFLFMRRTQSQLDTINKPEYSPFKSVDNDTDRHTLSKALSKYTAGYYDAVQTEDGSLDPVGPCLGYTAALSTIANLRGFDASDVTLMIYDEFIPERHERPIKNEGAALLNAYETVNRNRELQGRPPLQLLCLANANDLGNPIFMELGLVRVAEKMRQKKQELRVDPKRGICIVLLQDSPISAKKRDTALYRLSSGSEFSEMALDNSFSGEERSTVQSMPLSELRPVVAVGELCIYRHKAKRQFYASTHVTGSPPTFGAGEMELARFRRVYNWIWVEYMRNNIVFEEYLAEILLTKYFS